MRGSPSCVTVETRTAVSSVDRGVEGGILLDAGGGNFAVHADAYGRKASDYSIPGYPYLFDQTRPVNGRQPNSATQADGASIGGSYIFHGGFIGAAITQNDSLYRIPGIDGADHQTRIDAHQTKFTAKGEYRPDAAAIDAVTVLGRRHRLQAQRDRSRRSRRSRRRRRAADLYQQGAGRPRRGADDAVQRALCRRHHGLRPAGRTSGTDGAEPGRSRQPAQRFVGSEQEHQGRRLRLQRVQVHRHHQGADRRPYRACQSQRNDAGIHSGAVRPQRRPRRYRSATRAI